MLEQANVPVEILPVKLDESALRESMQAEGAPPQDIADLLAEAKAKRAAHKKPEAIVIGCDQVLAFQNEILGKAETEDEARMQLAKLNGQTHMLISAAVAYESGQPVWRHAGKVRMQMRRLSDSYLDDYVRRNWSSIRHSVGGYKLEEEGVRLFHRIDGDYFHVLGLPLLELLGYLTTRELIQG